MDLRDELAQAIAGEDPTERKIAVVAVVTAALADLRVRPVVVGGLAVEFWTYGEYATADIDILMPYDPQISARLAALGFEREGRHWVLPGSDVFLEAPGAALTDGEEAIEVAVGAERHALVLSVEDVLVARLEEFEGTGHSDPADQSILLLRAPDLDRARLERRVRERRVEHVLRAIESLKARADRGERIELWDYHDLARDLQRRGLR